MMNCYLIKFGTHYEQNVYAKSYSDAIKEFLKEYQNYSESKITSVANLGSCLPKAD